MNEHYPTTKPSMLPGAWLRFTAALAMLFSAIMMLMYGAYVVLMVMGAGAPFSEAGLIMGVPVVCGLVHILSAFSIRKGRGSKGWYILTTAVMAYFVFEMLLAELPIGFIGLSVYIIALISSITYKQPQRLGRRVMDEEQYLLLVQRLEQAAETSPKTYRARALLLTLAGYVYIYLVVAAVLGLLIFIGYVIFITSNYHEIASLLSQVILALFAVLFMIISSLRFKIPEPAGIRLTREDAPNLFLEVAQIREKMRGPKIHKILLTDQFQASIVQLPRLGLLGFHKNILTIGMPLLQGLSLEETRSVIAHEIGHLAGAHGRSGTFIYRTRLTWYRLLENLDKENRRVFNFIFTAFFQRFIPYFYAYTFVLIRKQEYEADAASAAVVGSEQMAKTLLSLNLKYRYMVEEFWQPLYAEANRSAYPPQDVYKRLEEFFERGLGLNSALKWLEEIKAEQTGIHDSHPGSSDRIVALGYRLEYLEAPTAWSRADLLGESYELLLDELSKAWYSDHTADWENQYTEYQKAKEQLDQLKQLDITNLTADEAVIYGSLVERLEGAEHAFSAYTELANAHREHPILQYHLGRLLLNKGDETGIAILKKVMRLDSQAILPACEVIINYLLASGREAEARAYMQQYREREMFLEEVQKERNNLGADILLGQHQLAAAEIEELCLQLQQFRVIKKAYLVRKDTELSREYPLFVLAVTYRMPMPARLSGGAAYHNEVVQMVAEQLQFPWELLVLPLHNFKLKKLITRMPGALIYNWRNRLPQLAEAAEAGAEQGEKHVEEAYDIAEAMDAGCPDDRPIIKREQGEDKTDACKAAGEETEAFETEVLVPRPGDTAGELTEEIAMSVAESSAASQAEPEERELPGESLNPNGETVLFAEWEYRVINLEFHKSIGEHTAKGEYLVALVEVTNRAASERELGWFFTAADQNKRIFKFDARASLAHHHRYRRGSWHLEEIEPSGKAVIPVAFDLSEVVTSLFLLPSEAEAERAGVVRPVMLFIDREFHNREEGFSEDGVKQHGVGND